MTERDPAASPGALRVAVLQRAAGAALPAERVLAAELGVPRSRLRRLLAELRAEGQLPPARVGRRAAAGPAGAGIDGIAEVANPADVLELRALIEPELARLAALRASPAEIARILRAAASRPGEGYGAADLAFHLEIAASTRNALARELYGLLRRIGRDARVRLPQLDQPCPKRLAARDEEHLEIARAIAERDPDRAAAAMRAHLASVARLVAARLAPSGAAA